LISTTLAPERLAHRAKEAAGCTTPEALTTRTAWQRVRAASAWPRTPGFREITGGAAGGGGAQSEVLPVFQIINVGGQACSAEA
jgi:hypothetical protein